MSMVTRCPGCNTVFRVTPQQLQAREGKVRCGRCALVFDGFKMLAAMPDQSASGLLETAQTSVAAAASSVAPPAVNEATVITPATEADHQDAAAIAAAPEPVPQAAVARTATQSPADAAEFAAAKAAQAAKPQPQSWEDELLAEPAPAVSQRKRWMWGAGSVLLLFTIAAQAVYFYRTELVSNYPGFKPALTQMCDALGCSVPLPQRHHLIKVEASDLQMVDLARPGVIQLTVTLRNPAAYDLAYPALDLVLTNTQDHTLARRIFLPTEYLGPGRDARAGIPANDEITVSLDLDTGDLGASGFRLYLLPAPAG
ncbi:MAG: DUF3426 domain-containing protein [Pseudomonadota bacterium]